MHSGLKCVGGKNGGTPSALKCMTSLFEQHKVDVEGILVTIPALAITTARCENETERNSDCMNIRYWAI